MKNRVSVTKNAMLRVLLTIVNIAVPLLAGPYLARILDVDLYAKYNQAVALLAWFTPFATLGVYNYAIREISLVRNNRTEVNKLFSQFFYISVISTLITSVVYYFVVTKTVASGVLPIYLITIIELIAQMFYVEWMNEAHENYSFILVKTLIIKIFYLISIFCFVKKADDILIFTLIASATVFANYFSSFVYVKRRTKFVKVELAQTLKLLKPLLVMLLLTNANLLFTYLDRLFLTIFSDKPIYSTYYQFSLSIVLLITQIINSIIIVTIPRLSKYLGEENLLDYEKLLTKSIHIYLLLGFPICIGMAVMANEGMLLYGGTKYSEAGTVLRVFAIRTILSLFDRIFATQILFVNSKEKMITKLYFITGGINLALDAMLVVIGQLTPVNLVITTIISEIILVTCQFYSLKYLNPANRKVFDVRILSYLFISCFFVPLYFVYNKFINIGNTISILFLLKIFGFIVICCLFYLLGLLVVKDPYVYDILQYIRKKLRPIKKYN